MRYMPTIELTPQIAMLLSRGALRLQPGQWVRAGDRRGRFGQLSGGRRDRRAAGSQQQRNRADQQPGGERKSCGADGFKKALQGRPLST